MSSTVSLFLFMPSFEERSLSAMTKFLAEGGDPVCIQSAIFSDNVHIVDENLSRLSLPHQVTFQEIDRLSSRDLWRWVLFSTYNASEHVVVDATGFTRELLGMILFALSIRRESLTKIDLLYTRPLSYVTQDAQTNVEDKWLSRGIHSVRSILGYPGNFSSDKSLHVLAFAGHEEARLWEVIEALEPDYLSISNESPDTSTVYNAEIVSSTVANALRTRIALPSVDTIKFSASSVEETFISLQYRCSQLTDRNVAIVAMNTKLSFAGAALYALKDRAIRLIYSVPEEYNPKYSKGSGPVEKFDITRFIKSSKPPPITLQRPRRT